ncbi:MAG: hypothetical protein NUV45_13545 [Tepidanaerobacteraceae bacterium]|jgi:hypothetical protein|nr:hypothetical protein [Tepidanaerobacteraceae bacterium]
MKVSELRELLKHYKEEDLRLIISEMYKSMPKKLREDKDIDTMLQDVHAYMSISKIERTRNEQVDVDDLKQEIEQFIDYAYKQYYFAPNSFVHKKERPKWRFKVKAFIKDLQQVPVESEDGGTATDLLKKLYEMLCYACNYYIFSTDNPFRSVGVGQTTLLDSVISRILGQGVNKENVKSVVELVINSSVDRETLHSHLIMELVRNLKTPDSKKIAIEQCRVLKSEIDNSKKMSSKKSYDSYEYRREEKINNLVETVFRLNMALCEYEEAIKYFHDNYVESDDEVSLYVLLDLLFEYELKEYWLREYDKALKKGIKPRGSLQKTRKFILENGSLPKYIHY